MFLIGKVLICEPILPKIFSGYYAIRSLYDGHSEFVMNQLINLIKQMDWSIHNSHNFFSF